MPFYSFIYDSSLKISFQIRLYIRFILFTTHIICRIVYIGAINRRTVMAMVDILGWSVVLVVVGGVCWYDQKLLRQTRALTKRIRKEREAEEARWERFRR